GHDTTWQRAAERTDVAAAWRAWRAAGITVTWLGGPGHPARLAADPEPVAVLFRRGPATLDAPAVAVVGTRRPTPDGRACAYHLGRDLAAAGVWVVSGLALGVDGAAHQGALDAGGPVSTVGVAASGVDVAYPATHAGLFDRLAAVGAVVAETAPGRPAQAWRFPSRNRVIAALADLVVVVESHAAGGSLLTAEAALSRGIEVRAVPGPVASPASAGTNQLLYDGAGPVRDATDVLDALGRVEDRQRRAGTRLVRPGPAPARQGRLSLGAAGGVAPQPGADATVRDAVGWRATSLGAVVARSGRPLGEVAAALERLRAAGVVAEEAGWWRRCR
ncbi:MAG TPA: DNA-processing protein DprA, partial [Acidimicrobiales bacterium]|nr:DNA-processing protein DprA [Acidimicrobiales bacterium]